MLSHLSAYETAALIHDSVWQRNELLSDELLSNSGLHKALGHMTCVEQVCISGNSDSVEPRYETLSKGCNGLYYFQATEGPGYVGDLSMGRHVIATSSGDELFTRFSQSLIVREFTSLTREIQL